MAQEYEQLLLKKQLCFPMYACSRKIVGSYAPYLKPLGLTYTQYVVLMALWEHESLNVGQLGGDPPSGCRNIDAALKET